MTTRVQATEPLAPPISSETADWWEATRDQLLLVQRCTACGAVQLYPRPLCLRCHASELTLERSSGLGAVLSFSIVHRSPDPDRYAAPYTVGLVRLVEGPILTTLLVGAPPGSWACDADVRAVWWPLPDGRHLPLFTPLDTDDGGRPWTLR
jgi:uncharacterized OB-fold protein